MNRIINRSYFHIFRYVTFVVLLLLTTACSMQQNNWRTRAYKSMNTRYNVLYNGVASFEEGVKNIATTHQDDYSDLILMFPISKHSNASAATSNMDRAIEKSRKAIKTQSIKIKPERNLRKWSNPNYQLWYKQNEFNPAIKDAWLLLGKAEFHKADFMGAVGTFSYISRHYATDIDMVVLSQLWIARAYAEMGWLYEAEQLLSKIKQDDIRRANITFYAAVQADLLLKKKEYVAAIPFLELTLSKEKNRGNKQRFSFLLAQLYERAGNNAMARQYYAEVSKLSPPYEMDFNAKLNVAKLNSDHPVAVRKAMNKLLRNSNNKDYLEQIYHVIAESYLAQNDTVRAIENFNLAIEKSTRNGNDKAKTLVTLADIYYDKKMYVEAQPLYDEASKIIDFANPGFQRVARRADALSELVTHHQVRVLQDSLQNLAKLPKEKQLEIVEKIIAKLIADEKKEEENVRQRERNAEFMNEPGFMPPIGMGGGAGDWYFYNPNLIKSGQTEFQRKWGRRKLEDNWRRLNKTTSLFAENSTNTQPESSPANTEGNADGENKTTDVSDIKNPAFYLSQIPVTPQQIEQSNLDIANALFNMGLVYKEKIEDFVMGIQTFDEFMRRFPNDKRVEEAAFQTYRMAMMINNQAAVSSSRNILLSRFPNSQYSKVVSQPDYFERLQIMYSEQDKLYAETYKAYNNNDFATVKANTKMFAEKFPLSDLLPKFLFLNAMSIGKTESQEVFEKELTKLVEAHPQSDVSVMSRDILALMLQGREAKKGGSQGSLLARRNESTTSVAVDAANAARAFEINTDTKHRIVLQGAISDDNMNKLMYNLASFNFTRFMVKDFDLVRLRIDSTTQTLSVTNLESFDEAIWYTQTIESDPSLSRLLQSFNLSKIIISEDNYALTRSGLTIAQYQQFFAQNLSKFSKKSFDAKAFDSNVAPVSKPVAVAPPNVAKPVESAQNIVPDNKRVVEQQQQQTVQPAPQVPVAKTSPTTVTPVEIDDTPLFKNLYAYKPNDPHYVTVNVLSGNFDAQQLKTVFENYNKTNYAVLNLKLNLEDSGSQKVLIIGSFADANIAKSYLLRMVREAELFVPLKGCDYRNLVGTQRNFNTMMSQNAMPVYIEFMREFYLK